MLSPCTYVRLLSCLGVKVCSAREGVGDKTFFFFLLKKGKDLELTGVLNCLQK